MTGNPVLDVFVVASIVAAGLGLFAVLGKCGRWVWRLFQRFDDLLDDLRGSPARPGVEARPGVMERLAGLETDVSAVKHEVSTNDGSSLKDAVKRVETKLSEVEDKIDSHLEGMEDKDEDR